MLFKDIETWLGRVRVVFGSDPFRVLRLYLPDTFSRENAFELSGFGGPTADPECYTYAEDLCRMIRDYLNNKKPIDPPWQWLLFEGLTPLQKLVLQTAAEIPFAGTRTYRDMAAAIGKPGAARFVGNTMAVNPYPLIIPCHRVIKSNGTAGGFGGGTEMKKMLIAHEAGAKHSVLARLK